MSKSKPIDRKKPVPRKGKLAKKTGLTKTDYTEADTARIEKFENRLNDKPPKVTLSKNKEGSFTLKMDGDMVMGWGAPILLDSVGRNLRSWTKPK
ncbi:MAG: hypothetical protein IEMM0002_1381 [bacterium]|nr:MAG: hypothetical protein IEMM0002_1381 [bacterium]